MLYFRQDESLWRIGNWSNSSRKALDSVPHRHCPQSQAFLEFLDRFYQTSPVSPFLHLYIGYWVTKGLPIGMSYV